MFISYAQNFEDVMLWRALGHLKAGFYIDVGANDPEVDSVTRAFYDRGWSGINIEPMPQWFDRLQQDRPRDVNLRLAAGAAAGETVIHGMPDTGLSTSHESIARGHETGLGIRRVEQPASVETLTAICRHFAVQTVHFLKIDVEGAEQEVLAGLDLAVVRPWIIVVESTLPMSQVSDHEPWEPMLLEGSYAFAYFDGLNRYYVAAEHGELIKFFQLPPNVFDVFSFSGTSSHTFCKTINAQRDAVTHQAAHIEAALRVRIVDGKQQAEAWLARIEAEWSARLAQAETFLHQEQSNAARVQLRLEQENAEALQAAAGAQEREAALRQSLSWRITAPLRGTLNLLRSRSRLRWPTNAQVWARASLLWALAQPGLVRAVHRALRPWPRLHSRIAQALTLALVVHAPPASFSGGAAEQDASAAEQSDSLALTPRGRDIHRALAAAKKREDHS